MIILLLALLTSCTQVITCQPVDLNPSNGCLLLPKEPLHQPYGRNEASSDFLERG